VVVGAGALLGAVGTALADPFCGAGLAWWCFLALCRCFGLAALVVVVAGVDWVVDVLLVAAALWLEVVEEEAPQALTTKTSRTAPSAVRRCLMTYSQGRRSPRVASREIWLRGSRRAIGERAGFPRLGAGFPRI
jgi:hypothetical protein